MIRILLFGYKAQFVCLTWSQCTSLYFNVSNGLSQGSILSPKLFPIYVDDLSYALSSSNAGCFMDNVCINHLKYADDICIFAPTSSSLLNYLIYVITMVKWIQFISTLWSPHVSYLTLVYLIWSLTQWVWSILLMWNI